MAEDGAFEFEDCLLKHHVRVNGWLPFCAQRKRLLNNQAQKGPRRLRYFTFCAVGAIDVLMLDVAKIIAPSSSGRFDTVFFFDKDSQLVDETTKRVPGAIGYPGEFVDIVLADDPNGDDPLLALAPPQDAGDTLATRATMRLLATRREFLRQFPFDAINLDLERYLFRPRDSFPGQLVRALQRVFEWQRRPLIDLKTSRGTALEGFTLMLTTPVGPPELRPDYADMLRSHVETNISDRPELEELFERQTGTRVVDDALRSNFDIFFRLAVPKLIASLLDDEDWFVDPKQGVMVFEFERLAGDRKYKMLHLAMHVSRKVPPKEARAPRSRVPVAEEAYGEVVRKLFTEPAVVVKAETIDSVALAANLEKIKARRRKYYPEGR